MEQILQNLASQLGAVGILIWFLFHLYQRIEKRLETREEQFEIQRKDLIVFYENKIKAIVRDYREDAKSHKQDRDEWFKNYLEVTSRFTEILHSNTTAFSKHTSALASCPHNPLPKNF